MTVIDFNKKRVDRTGQRCIDFLEQDIIEESQRLIELCVEHLMLEMTDSRYGASGRRDDLLNQAVMSKRNLDRTERTRRAIRAGLREVEDD